MWKSLVPFCFSNEKQHFTFAYNESNFPVICIEEETEMSGCLVRIRRRVSNPTLPSVLLANLQSLDNKMDEVRSRLSYQRDIKYCNILCFTESWLNDDTDNIELAGCTGRTEKLRLVRRGVGVCLFLNKSWCADV